MADRNTLINQIYYQELGRLEADPQGLKYWLGRTDLNDEQLRAQIRGAGLGPDAGASVKAPLLADQGYAAWMRGMQFDESQVQSNLQAAQEAAQRRITGQAGQFNNQRKQSTNNVNSSFEARQNRSGKRLVQINDGTTAIDLQQGQYNAGISEESAQMERNAAASIADLRRQDAEQQLGARDRLTQASATFA